MDDDDVLKEVRARMLADEVVLSEHLAVKILTDWRKSDRYHIQIRISNIFKHARMV